MYREIAPRLVAEDSEFRREYEKMREQVHISGARISGAAHADGIHRKWLPSDTKVVEAWLSGRHPYSGETWDQFLERIAASRLKMLDARQENILVVTSATPLAIWTSHWRFPISGSRGSPGQCITHPIQSCVCEKSSYGYLPSMRCRTSPPGAVHHKRFYEKVIKVKADVAAPP